MRINQPRYSRSAKAVITQSLERHVSRYKYGSKYRTGEHENHQRWLVSYADFITLLLALFVVMYGISQINEGKHRALAASLAGLVRVKPERADMPAPTPEKALPATEVLPTTEALPTADQLTAKKARRFAEAQRRRQEKMENVARDILAAFDPLSPLLKNGQVRIIQSNLGLGLEINASVLFAPGQADVHENSSKVLEVVARVLKDDDHAVQVEGHTDDMPIDTERFPSNWELSAVRASSVVRLLISNGVDAKRLMAAGFGENRPVGSNDTEGGRMRNRRVTIMILSNPPEPFSEVPDPPSDTGPEALPDLLPYEGNESTMLLSGL